VVLGNHTQEHGPIFSGAWVDQYPGDLVARTWAHASPHRFLVFPMGTRSARTWCERSALLRSLGWGLAVLYSPRVIARFHPATAPLSRSLGAADGYDAVSQCRSEGMRPGVICYLDLAALWDEVGRPGDHWWQEYYKGWTGAVLDSGVVLPGTRCRDCDASAAAAVARSTYVERRRHRERPPFWVVVTRMASDGSASLGPPLVSASTGGPPWRASIWQTSRSLIHESVAGHPMALAPCYARRRDPSFHPSTLDPASCAAAARVAGSTPEESTALGNTLEARHLLEACLGVLGTIQGVATPPFPHGVSTVEIRTSRRDDATDVRIRVLGSRSPQG
jgi:hypothetical protein